MSAEVLILLDIETTGLDFKQDALLEVYAEARTVDGIFDDKPISSIHLLIDNRVLPPIDTFVLNMHNKSGLWEALRTEPTLPLEVVLTQLKEWLAQFPRARLVGRNVGTFDRPFLEAKQPGCTEGLSYQHVDISTILNVFRWWDEPLNCGGAGNHRSQGDVEADLEILRLVAEIL